MPGPCNSRKKKKLQHKKEKRAKPIPSLDATQLVPTETPPEITAKGHSSTPSPLKTAPNPPTPPPNYVSLVRHPTIIQQPPPTYPYHLDDDSDHNPGLQLPQRPFIEDPGNGPRVRDPGAFLASSFASPASVDDPLCAEFAQEEILQMLCSVLPQETAMILWYNKSRLKSRICPACERLYRLGDKLVDPLDIFGDEEEPLKEDRGRATDSDVSSGKRYREQQISGLCSPVCFILAAYNYPAAIRSTWGRMGEELSDEAWDAIEESSMKYNDNGLGMLLKMTRCHDLGLGQLFFPGEEFSGETDNLREEKEDHIVHKLDAMNL
ncbi:hypothetical protein C8Q75DRAFT_766936 [Abortiporus biennis]|nr:hypothetical protein C8Q75DRAFT_766936 [Abortiporus biennis]